MKVGDLVKLITIDYLASRVRDAHGQLAIVVDYNEANVNPWRVLVMNMPTGDRHLWFKHHELELL